MKTKLIDSIINIMRLNWGSNGIAKIDYLQSLPIKELKKILYSQECYANCQK